ncbi:hypothetical protein ABT297_39380 [Dactylosporangium sp. NPDC000555]|uniref:hypothetical protein n=1 Tax=Dactylosporangium sp. NPDC000555 TaxID=3154260 RepID=UPI0033230611
MSEQPVRRGWRGEAAGIPPVRIPVPSVAAAPASPAGARAEPPAAEPREEFPLWPMTGAVALHETPAPVGTPAVIDAPAHEAGRTAVLDHLAARPEPRRPKPGRAEHGRPKPGRSERWGSENGRPEPGQPEPGRAEHERAEDGRAEDVRAENARAEPWPLPVMRAARQPRDERRAAPVPRRPRRIRPARGPLAGLSAMLLVAALTGFFAWTSAEPFWLDMGHAVRGTAEVTSCKGSGVLRHCLADFAAPGHEPVGGARLMGLDEAPGASVAAAMVPGGRVAYAGDPAGLRVRWAVGLGLVALCGIALAWLTGAWRFARLRDRLAAWALTAAAPLILGVGIVLAAR